MNNASITLASQLMERLIAKSGGVLRHPAYDDLTRYAHQIYPRYEDAPHLRMIHRDLTQVTRFVESGGTEGIGRLIIEMPPRHGKTLTVSKIYPTWHLGRNPEHRLMLVSYGQDLANKNSRGARAFIRGRAYKNLFNHELATDSSAVNAWDLEGREGGMDALGIGGGAAGKGAHVLIIDDPIKNRQEAESITYRDRVYEAFTNDLLTRLAPGGAVIVMMTRWQEDDLTGRLLKLRGEQWTRLRLPAIAEENDPMGRAVGEALWPERYPIDVLREFERDLGPYAWASLYQQSPRPAEGGIIKKSWFTRVRIVPEYTRSVRYWDLAMSAKTGADYTVGLRIDEGRDGNLYISDVARERVELHDLPRFIRDVMQSDGPVVAQGFEHTGYMTRAIQEIAKDSALRAYNIKSVSVREDKLTRLLPAAARAALGVIYLREAGWNHEFIDELASFPNGAHDDQVDAFSGAYQMISEPLPSARVARTQTYL